MAPRGATGTATAVTEGEAACASADASASAAGCAACRAGASGPDVACVPGFFCAGNTAGSEGPAGPATCKAASGKSWNTGGPAGLAEGAGCGRIARMVPTGTMPKPVPEPQTADGVGVTSRSTAAKAGPSKG